MSSVDAAPDARAAAFEAVVAEVLEPVRRYLARRTDPATAEDVTSEVLLVLWRRLDAVPEHALPWAYGVTRSCLANAERGSRRQRRLAARIATVDPPTEVAPAEVTDHGADRIAAALAALPARDAELLRLWAWEQLGPAEIAGVLGITPNAVSIRLHRAREKLRAVLRKQDAGAGHEQPQEGSGR